MTAQDLLSGLSNVPSIAIVFFFVLGAVLIAEAWYLRPKRKLPPIPPSGGAVSPEPVKSGPLSQNQIYLVGFLIFLLVVIPLAVFLYKRTQETKQGVSWQPSPTADVREYAPATRAPRSRSIPTPSPSATPKKLAGGGLVTPTPVSVPTSKPTMTPTPTPKQRSKGGLVSPSPSSTPYPKVKKPGELPDASFSNQALLLIFTGTPALLLGVNEVKKRIRE